jgi:hypothetical protein
MPAARHRARCQDHGYRGAAHAPYVPRKSASQSVPSGAPGSDDNRKPATNADCIEICSARTTCRCPTFRPITRC